MGKRIEVKQGAQLRGPNGEMVKRGTKSGVGIGKGREGENVRGIDEEGVERR